MNTLRSIAAAAALLSAASAQSATPVGVDTRISIVWICGAVAAVVFAAIFYSVVAFRHVEAKTSVVPKRLQELAWALVPMAIVIAAAAPAIRDASRTASTLVARDSQQEAPQQSDQSAAAAGVNMQVASR